MMSAVVNAQSRSPQAVTSSSGLVKQPDEPSLLQDACAHPRSDIRSYVSELLVTANPETHDAYEAGNLLHELAVDSGFRGRSVRPLLMSELAEYEISFLQRISVGKPLPELLSLLDGSTRFISPTSAQELADSESARWTRIVAKHLYSLAFQTEWNEEHLIQFRHALLVGERLFFSSEDESPVTESQKSVLAKAATDALSNMSNLDEFLREKPLCAETLLRAINFLRGCHATASGEVLERIFSKVDRIYQEMTPQDGNAEDYFKFEGTVGYQTENNINSQRQTEEPDTMVPQDEPNLDAGEPSRDDEDYVSHPPEFKDWGDEQDQHYQQDNNWYDDTDDSEVMESDATSVAEGNTLYHVTETLHLALLRTLKTDPLIKDDCQFWSDLVYENNYYMPGMPIAIQGLVQSSLNSLHEFIDPLLYALSRDSAPIVHLLALLETQDDLRAKYGIEIFELFYQRYCELPANIRHAVLETIESTVSTDLSIMANLSESELCEEEMAILIGELLNIMYDGQ